ncbi:MAG TPA: hypothetical protein VMU17_02670, partial [Elusimicrobiota bacterium]|nr:hypothetical protein [Elusimicrobiota bacterium]
MGGKLIRIGGCAALAASMVGTSFAGEQWFGRAKIYRTVDAPQLQSQAAPLQSPSATPQRAMETSSVIHNVAPLSVDDSPPAATQPALLPVVLFSRPDLDHAIAIILSDDPEFRFTPRERRDIRKILDAVPPDFLQGITAIEARRHPDLPVLSDGEAPQIMKLAETVGDRVIIYARP